MQERGLRLFLAPEERSGYSPVLAGNKLKVYQVAQNPAEQGRVEGSRQAEEEQVCCYDVDKDLVGHDESEGRGDGGDLKLEDGGNGLFVENEGRKDDGGRARRNVCRGELLKL